MLDGTDGELASVGDPGVAVSHVDDGPLGASEDRPDSDFRACFDEGIGGVAEQILNAFLLEYAGNRVCAVHNRDLRFDVVSSVGHGAMITAIGAERQHAGDGEGLWGRRGWLRRHSSESWHRVGLATMAN